MHFNGKFLINCKAPFDCSCNLGQPPSKCIFEFDPGESGSWDHLDEGRVILFDIFSIFV